MWATGYPKAIIYSETHGSAAHTAADIWRNKIQQIVGGRMEEPGVVEIGWLRGGVEVVVEVDETLVNRTESTQMRVAGRPHRRLIRCEAGGRNYALFAYRGERCVRLTTAREACA